jgi:hypothetical protein
MSSSVARKKVGKRAHVKVLMKFLNHPFITMFELTNGGP